MTSEQPIPLCDINIQYKQLEPQILAAVERVLASGQVILGPEVEALEDEIAQYCQTRHGVGCASGSDALLLAIQGLQIGDGDEVILPPFTFFACVGAVCRAGARPVFVDIEPDTYNIDPAQIEKCITPRTKAIMVVHLFGQCAEMQPIQELARKHDIAVIEDSAQAIGAEYFGRRAGALGDVSCYSFYPSKNLGACGEAGMVVTNHEDLAALMTRLRNHGMDPKYVHKWLGWNARIDAIQAAVLRVKFTQLDHWTRQRQEAAKRYDWLIKEHQIASLVQRPFVAPHRRHIFNQYVIRVADHRRDELLAHLRSRKIGCEVYYPIPLHLQECFTFLGYEKGDFPVSEQAADQVAALPMFPGITESQQQRVIVECAKCLREPVRKTA